MSNPWDPPERDARREVSGTGKVPPGGQPAPVYQPPGGYPPPAASTDHGSGQQPVYGGHAGQAQPGPGQPAPGEPGHGQPSYGQPSYGEASYSRSAEVQYPGQQPGYAGQLYGQPAFGQPGYLPAGYGQRTPETDQNAIVALVLAVMSWMVCPVILAVVALVMAGNAQREIDASQGAKSGDGLVKAARIVSWINIAFYAALLVIAALAIIIAVAASPGTTTTTY